MEKMFRYDRNELLGVPIETLLPERFRESHPILRQGFYESPIARAMGAGRELFGRRKDGSEFPVEIGLNPINNYDGESGVVLASLSDITERKNQEENFQRIVEAAPNGMVMLNTEGKFLLKTLSTLRNYVLIFPTRKHHFGQCTSGEDVRTHSK